MKYLLYLFSICAAIGATAQSTPPVSPMYPLQYGVILDDPGMKTVVVQPDVPFLKDAKGTLHMDVYQPPGLKSGESRPAVVFLNAIGDQAAGPKLKTWGIYSSWPRLVAAQGYIGISMECDGARIQESIGSIFDFITQNSSKYHIDASRLGVYAASANVRESKAYLMSDRACKGIKAAALYYGDYGTGPFRKDLPVLAVIVEADVRPGRYDNVWQEALSNKAPWTIKMASGMPHAFDAFSDNDEARRIVMETISFWKNHLDPVPAPSWKPSPARDVLGLTPLERPRAFSIMKTMLSEYPDDMEALSFYVRHFSDMIPPAEVEAGYQKIIKNNPADADALMNYATFLFRANKQPEAEKQIDLAVKTGNMNGFHYANAGYNFLLVNNNPKAVKMYEEAVKQIPNGLNYYNLACGYSKTGDIDKAFGALEKAIENGFESRNQIMTDPDLAPLKTDKRFEGVLAKVK